MKNNIKRIALIVLSVLMVFSQIPLAYADTAVSQESTGALSLAKATGPEKLQTDANESGSGNEKLPEGIVPGKVMVKYKSNISAEAKSSLKASVSAVAENSVKKLGITELELSEDADVQAAVDKLNADSNVVFAEPVYVRKAVSAMPAPTVVESVYCQDEFYNKGWQWGLQAASMEGLWGEASEEAQSDIVIAVIDTGVDEDHPEFSGRLVDGYDFVNNDSDPDDDYGHGTHVAGIAAAANDDIGMGGVASGAMIMPVKVLDENGYGDTVSIVNGIIYAVNNGADVINLSLGGDYSHGEELAVEYAIDHGVVVVAAAGNDHYDEPDYPAACDGVISVGAADWNGSEFVMADFSNYGSSIDMVAPGVDILSAIPEELDNLDSGVGDAREDGYALMSGTSMATPFVAGTAALLLTKGEGIKPDSPDSSVCDQVLQLMQKDGIDFSDSGFDYKLLNGNGGDYDAPFLFKRLQLSVEETAEDDKIELYLTAGDYRNGSTNTMGGSYSISKIPLSRDEYGYVEIGDPEDAGTIELTDGEGTVTVEVYGDYDYVFVAGGGNEYLDSNFAVPEDNDDSFDAATELQIGATEYGAISKAGDADYYTFTTPAGSEVKDYLIESLGSMDTYGYLYDNEEKELERDDDSGEGANFGIIYELEPSTTYYVKVTGFGGTSTGYYGVYVKEYQGAAEEKMTINGKISRPEGSMAAEAITGYAVLIECEWYEEYGEYNFYVADSEQFTIASGESDVEYALESDTGGEYIVAYKLTSVGSEYVAAAFYTPEGMTADIHSAWLAIESRTADMELLKKTSAEATESAYDTQSTAKELTINEDSAAALDYLGDADYYKFKVEETGSYMLKLMKSFSELYGKGTQIVVLDSSGNELNPIDGTGIVNIISGGEDIGCSGVYELPAGEYFVVIWVDNPDSLSKKICFAKNDIPFGIYSAEEIRCTAKLAEGYSPYDGDFYLSDSADITYHTYDTITAPGKTFSIYVPESTDKTYILGFRREGASQLDIMGYYSDTDGGKTVMGIGNATSINVEGKAELSFEINPIADEPNNSVDTAEELSGNVIYSGVINNIQDADYFKLNAPTDGSYAINFSWQQEYSGSIKAKYKEADMAILLYENNKWVEYAQGKEGSFVMELKAGTYIFKVICDGYGVGTYQLGLQSSPVASNVTVSGNAKSGNTLTGSYTYADAQGDAEAGSTYRWLSSATADGTYTAISGETGKAYSLDSSDVGKYIKFEVTPVSGIEPTTGTAVLSSAVGPVAQADSTKHKGGSGRGSGSGSGTGTSTGTGTTPGTTANQETPSGSAVITTGANGSTSSVIQVDGSRLATALDTTGTNPVSIDARTAANTDSTAVVLPGGVLKEAEKLRKPVIVHTNNVSFEMQPGTINIGDTEQSLRLEVQELTLDAVPEAERNMNASADEVSMVFDFGMYLGSQRITDFNKPITITVKYDPSKVTDTSKLGVYYYNEKDGRWEYVGGKVNSDGTITFTVEHFSKYAVMEFKSCFEDIKNHWAQKSIELILARQITNGVDQKSFAPDRKISRAEFTAMLVRALKLEKTTDKNFTDVAGNAWYKGYLQKAYAAGIISGDSFDPASPITREQMAEMLVRAYSHSSGTRLEDMRTTQQIRFKDEGMSEGTSRESIILADALGLMKGNPDGTFAPKSNSTRAEAAVTIIRILERLGRL